MTIYQKQELLASVHSLDAVQSEQVLQYIRGILQHSRSGRTRHHSSKRKALKEIDQALRQAQHPF